MFRRFHPLLRAWFRETYGTPSDPQQRGWPEIAKGDHTLILAPTGTGKTLAAFLWELDVLIRAGAREPLPNSVQLVYVSPLKALNNDIHRNLEQPLRELRSRFEGEDRPFPEIRVAVRTGDTPRAARARMLRVAPHILITTPESLHIMLTTTKGRGMFSGVRTIIIDEIHAVAGTKRGAHLALSIERLQELASERIQRIGLSATQRPLDEVARFLGGIERSDGEAVIFRPVTIVDCGMAKPMELTIHSPLPDLGNVGGSVWPAVAPLVLDHIRSARTTLVFVNNRAQAEKIAARVNALAEEEIALPYHGSLSRERRLILEQRLKGGELRALVTTSSLELGIDIGSVDLVLQLQSPKRVSSALQRVGRAGHRLGVASKAVFIPTFRDDAVETTAILDAMREGAVEPTQVVQNALDILAQVVVAATSVDDRTVDDLFDMVRRAYPFHRLSRDTFEEVVAMLSGKYPSDLASELEPRVSWDRLSGRLSGSNASRLTAVISGGTIPDRGLYTVNLPDRTRLGELDEEFVHESRVGDVFQLGSTTWRIASIEHDRVIVTPAPGAPARMPFWHGEYGARSFALSTKVGEVRRAAATGDQQAITARYACDEGTARTLVNYVSAQRAATGVVPDEHSILIEEFRDETGAVRIVLHAPFGGRVNAPWGMVLSRRVSDMLGVELQVQTTDDGIMLRLPDLGSAPPVHTLTDVHPEEAERIVLEEVGGTSLFGARFRMNAARALLLPRGNPRRRMPLWLQRLKSLDLLQTVQRFPSFPILIETYREVLQDAFDMNGLREVLEGIRDGRISVRHIASDRPSPFAASLQFGFVMDWLYGDDTPRAEQRAALLAVDRTLLADVLGAEATDEGMEEAIREVVAVRAGTASERRARTADELAQTLDRAGDLGMGELAERVATVDRLKGDPVGELFRSHRAVMIPFEFDSTTVWRAILAETFPRYAAAFGVGAETVIKAFPAGDTFPSGPFAGEIELGDRQAREVVPSILLSPSITAGAARREILARYMSVSGPTSVEEIAGRYGWAKSWIEARLMEWQRMGRLIEGRFRSDTDARQWCSRRVVEVARRRALAKLRRQIAPVGLQQFARFLQSWQHLSSQTVVDGANGVAVVMQQLYGIPRPAAAWERDYLRARVRAYVPGWLSEFMASGETVWVGESSASTPSGIRPIARLRFFERGTGALWLHETDETQLSPDAQIVRDAIASEGASFLTDLQVVTGLSTLALREALRELVAAGLVTNDTVEAMREIVRWKPLQGRNEPDPTRWLPADFTPSPNRYVVQRRPNLRRLPKWRRPDRPGAAPSSWSGRWSLVRRPGALGPRRDEASVAEAVARQWLDRYGVVTRDWWKRERPTVSWRAIYNELKRLEFRGEVRRGYFVEGLSGAQFALPESVERLRAVGPEGAEEEFIVMAASDPANPYSLPLSATVLDPLGRPRGRAALLVMKGGRVALAVEGRGRRIVAADWLTPDELRQAKQRLREHLHGERGARFLS
jgi:ATP-dependent helicase Lhr and Lhr-like helicase